MEKAQVATKVDAFFEQFPLLSFKKGQVILSGEKNPEGIHYIKKGFVRQFIFTEEGAELTLHFFKPGSFFPLFWAINNLPNRYYYQAFTEVETHQAPKEQTLEFLKSSSEILFDLSKRLLFGLDGLVTRIESLSSTSAKDRTIGILLFLGKHFGKKEANMLTLTEPFTHEDISNLTGFTRETTSRELENLTRKGLIIIKKHMITIPDLSKLQ